MIAVSVSQEFLRALFKEMEIEEGVKQGLYTRRPYWTSKRRPRHLSVGTRSVMLEYSFPNGQRIVKAHEFRGRGSQRLSAPDPKAIHYGRFVFSIGDDP